MSDIEHIVEEILSDIEEEYIEDLVEIVEENKGCSSFLTIIKNFIKKIFKKKKD